MKREGCMPYLDQRQLNKKTLIVAEDPGCLIDVKETELGQGKASVSRKVRAGEKKYALP